MRENFLVTSRDDMKRRGWDQLDFVYINGDAYVDHPGFAAALSAASSKAGGYRVGLISQPDWHSADAFKALGRPRLAALITAGNLDSMLNEKTAARKFRSRDSYSPGGETGHRPERATIVYANRMREAYKDVPIIIGGIEPACAVLPITTTGPIRCAIRYSSTARPISSVMAWGNTLL